MTVLTRWKDIKTWINWFIYDKFTKKELSEKQDMVNKAERDTSEAVRYTINSVKEIIHFLPNRSMNDLHGKIMLEIGPGQDIGILLVLMGLGVRKVYIIDPFFYDWDDHIHAEYYHQLLISSQEAFPGYPFETLRKVITGRSYAVPEIEIIRTSLEEINGVPDHSIDVSFSNACFEHLHDSRKAIYQLSRITKKGGIGFHQIDLRDHRDYEKPLEFLSMSDFLFKRVAKLSNYCFGNRVRHYEFQQIFEDNGFKSLFKPNLMAEETYLKEVAGRFSKKYKKTALAELRPVCGRFFIQKK